VGGAAARVPVLLDGVAVAAAAVVAAALVPDCVGYLFAGHRSTEPGSSAALEHLGFAQIRVYIGSFREWSRRPEFPVERVQRRASLAEAPR
jgi:NaMN:DMB phosphoribosyltransferase